MASTQPRGERLVVTVIDQYAREEPERAWVSIPRTDKLSDGYVDVTYKQLANAVSHAALWLDASLGPGKDAFETFAYVGPKDLRYPVLAVAAVKVGRKLLLPSTYVTKESQLHLLGITKCAAYLHATSFTAQVSDVLLDQPKVRQIVAPEVESWIFGDQIAEYPYIKTWEEAKYDPWLIFHTSGTTGHPKPITYTNLMMTSFDATLLMPEANGKSQAHRYVNERIFSPLPAPHFVGMTAVLQMAALLGSIIILGLPDKPPTAELADQAIQYGNATSALLPPFILEDLCRKPAWLERVKKLKYIDYAGAPLNQAIGDLISPYVQLTSAIGCTESGPYFLKIHSDPAWNYHHFTPSIGLELEPRGDDLYEAVFRRKKELERWQQIFFVYPHLDSFPTGDLLKRHPTNPDLWAYVGRTDDLVILSLGHSLYVSEMEAVIVTHPLIRSAIIGGQGKKKPFLLLELTDESTRSGDQSAILESIWPTVMRASEKYVELLRLTKALTLFSVSSKPFVRTAKGSVARKQTLELYKKNTDAIYDHLA